MHRFVLSWSMHRTDTIRQRESSPLKHTHLAAVACTPLLDTTCRLSCRGAGPPDARELLQHEAHTAAQDSPAADSVERASRIVPRAVRGPRGQGWQGRGGLPLGLAGSRGACRPRSCRNPRRATPGEISDPRPATPSDPGHPARAGHLSNSRPGHCICLD